MIKLKIFHKIGIYSISDWNLIGKNLIGRYKKIKNEKLIPGKNSKLSLITKTKLSSGWYLFGILHFGENNRLFGSIFSKNNFFKQSRPMYPSRRRWRILRIRDKSQLIIELKNIKNFISIKEIWVIRIPFFEATRRIKNRLKANYNILLLDNNFINLWHKYNKLLKSQDTQAKILNYSDWINTVEIKKNNFLKSFQTNNILFFEKRKEDNYSPVNNKNEWVLFISKNHKLEMNVIKITQRILSNEKNLEIIYFDEDHINKFSQRYNPNFKTSWNRELFFCDPNFITSCFIKTSAWNNALKILSECNYSINIFSILIVITFNFEKNGDINRIAHVPYIGFHNLSNQIFKEDKLEENLLFLKKFLKNNKEHYGDLIDIKKNNHNLNSLTWVIPNNSLISIIIPTKDKLDLLKKCIDSIKKFKPGISTEIIIINNDSVNKETYNYFSQIKKEFNSYTRLEIINISGEFNFSKFNNIACRYSQGNVLLLLNNDVHFIRDGWGYHLAQNALRNDIGCVGAKLLYDDMNIQHAGVIMGIGGVAGHSHKHLSGKLKGYQNRLISTQEYSAVTGACLAISKNKFEKLNGFNEKKLKVNYNDVDLCLRAKEQGLKNIYLPDVIAIHLESKSRGKPFGNSYKQWIKESKFIKNNWYAYIKNDPFYNINLSLEDEQFNINFKNNSKIHYRLGNQTIYKQLTR